MHKLIAKFIGFDKVQQILKKEPNVYGQSFVSEVIKDFGINYTMFDENFDIESYNSTIFFSTHHSGALDFLCAFNALKDKAPNLKVLVNNQLMDFAPVAKVAIATYPVSAKADNSQAREEIIAHLNNGGNLLVFPAGKVAGKNNGEITDSQWRKGIFEIFRNHASCGVPVYIKADNGNAFYFIRKLFPKISMLFLMRCLSIAAKNDIKIVLGRATPRYKLDTYSALETLQYFRNRTYELKYRGENHDSQFTRDIRRENGRVLAGDF